MLDLRDASTARELEQKRAVFDLPRRFLRVFSAAMQEVFFFFWTQLFALPLLYTENFYREQD